MYITSFKCGKIVFDIFDSERVNPNTTDNSYYVTPKILDRISEWCKEKNILTKLTDTDVKVLITKNIIGTYNGR